MAFIVYHGYVTPDNYSGACDGNPPYEIVICATEKQVAKLRAEHESIVADSDSECSHPIFRVFEGVEVKMKPIARVTEWEIEK